MRHAASGSHNRKSITWNLPRSRRRRRSRSRRKGSCGCGWFFFLFFYFSFFRCKKANKQLEAKQSVMNANVSTLTHSLSTHSTTMTTLVALAASCGRRGFFSRTVHSFLSTKVAENKREFWYIIFGWFLFLYKNTMTESSNAIEQWQHVPSADERRTRAREREREWHNKGEDSRALRAHTTVAFSGRRTSGREQQTGSACRTAGGVRVATEAEQKSKRSTHTVNTIEECQWELVLSAPLCNSLIHFVVVAVPLVCCTWRTETETIKRRLIQIRSRN